MFYQIFSISLCFLLDDSKNIIKSALSVKWTELVQGWTPTDAAANILQWLSELPASAHMPVELLNLDAVQLLCLGTSSNLGLAGRKLCSAYGRIQAYPFHYQQPTTVLFTRKPPNSFYVQLWICRTLWCRSS